MIAFAFFGLFALLSSPADACRCAGPGITIWPKGKKAVPRNTQVWVRLPALSSKLTFGRYNIFQDYPSLWAHSFELKVIRLDLIEDGPTPKGIACQRTTTISNQWRMINLKPTKPLAPNTNYKVRIGVGAWNVILTTFKTSGQGAQSAPPKPTVEYARYLQERQTFKKCQSPTPFAAIKLNKSPATLVGVWAAQGDEINFNAPPSLVLPANKVIHLGRHHQCAEENFVFPEGNIVKVGLRHGDIAGNWSPGTTVTFAKGGLMNPYTWSPNGRVLFWYVLALIIFLIGAIRAWIFQRASNQKLGDYLLLNSSIEGDAAWLGVRRLVQNEKPFRLGAFLLGLLHLALVLFAFFIYFNARSHFSISPTASSQLNTLFFSLTLALFCHWLINLTFWLRIRSKRAEIANLPIAASFEKASHDLFKGWGRKKKG